MKRGFDFSDYVLPVGFLALGMFAFNKIMKGDSSETSSDAAKDIVKKELTYTESWYSQAADKIESNLLTVYKSRFPLISVDGNTAMKNVFDVLLRLKNKSDWNKLLDKFGNRSGFSMSIVVKEPLTKWLQYFLSDKKYKSEKDGKKLEVNAYLIVQTILKKIDVSL